jgi:hypothetical protein
VRNFYCLGCIIFFEAGTDGNHHYHHHAVYWNTPFDPLQMVNINCLGISMLVIEASDVMLHSVEQSFPTRLLPGDYELTGSPSSATLGSCREHKISSLLNIYEEVC